MFKQFIFYALVGGVGTLGHYAVLWASHELIGLPLLAATTLGFICGAMINYLLNYFYVFKSRRQHKKAASRFFSIAITGMLLNYLLMYLLSGVTSHSYWINQLLTTAIILVTGYLLNRLWTFAQED